MDEGTAIDPNAIDSGHEFEAALADKADVGGKGDAITTSRRRSPSTRRQKGLTSAPSRKEAERGDMTQRHQHRQ